MWKTLGELFGGAYQELILDIVTLRCLLGIHLRYQVSCWIYRFGVQGEIQVVDINLRYMDVFKVL